MATLLELRRRVRSVKNMRQITRAMKLVSAAKLRRAQDRMMRSRPYDEKLWQVLGDLAMQGEHATHPLLQVRREDRITAVVITSDRGLCGAFNSNVMKYAHRALRVWDDRAVQLVCIGRKGYEHFRRRNWPIARGETDMLARLSYPEAAEIGDFLIREFVEDRTDAVYLIYNEFISVLRQQLVVEPLLPIRGLPLGDAGNGASYRQAARAWAEVRTGGEVAEGFGAIGRLASDLGESLDELRTFAAAQGEPTELVEYLYEPDADAILAELLPRFVEANVYQALLESAAAEHAARMAAMSNATKNAEDLIADLTLTMNKIRQEAITTEILEVVGGAEALA